jgi:hypothetical protein
MEEEATIQGTQAAWKQKKPRNWILFENSLEKPALSLRPQLDFKQVKLLLGI